MPKNPNSGPDSGGGSGIKDTRDTLPPSRGALGLGEFKRLCEDRNDGLGDGGAARGGLQPMAKLLESL